MNASGTVTVPATAVATAILTPTAVDTVMAPGEDVPDVAGGCPVEMVVER